MMMTLGCDRNADNASPPSGFAFASRLPCSNATCSRPASNLLRQPQLAPALSQIHDGPGHVVIAVLVRAHTVRVRQAEQVSNAASINEIGRVNGRHRRQSTTLDRRMTTV